MKIPRKDINGFLICEECERTYKKLQSLSIHIHLKHNIKEYYDKWLKEENEGKCKICGGETEFQNLKEGGYRNCCSNKCSKEYGYEQTKKSNFKKYGVENPYQRKDIKEEIEKINIKKYGVKNFLLIPKEREKANNKRKKTNFEKYGNEKILVNNSKREKTCFERYGVKNPIQNKTILDKVKKTNIKRYGVEFPNQNKKIFDKGMKIRFQTRFHENSGLNYQGTYELDFLEKYFKKIIINTGPSILYFEKKEKHIYHSDFYLPSLNLIIEIKNSYLAKKDLKINILKEKACRNLGYDFLMIINKNYKEFNKRLIL